SGGTVSLWDWGGSLEGNIVVGGTLNAEDYDDGSVENATITIDLSQRQPSDDAAIVNIDELADATFAISVSATQKAGTYRLATGGEAFDKDFTLTVQGTELTKTLAFDNPLTVNGLEFLLEKQDSDILLTVEKNVPFVLSLSCGNATVAEGGRLRCIVSRGRIGEETTVVRLAVTDGDSRLKVPETVTIGAGESSAVFYVELTDDTDFQGAKEVQLTATTDGIDGSAFQTLSLLDNDKSQISFELVATEVTEGNSWSQFGKIKLEKALDKDITVKLSYDKSQLSGIPDAIVIKAGQTEASFGLSVIDDKTAEIDKNVKITASADGFQAGTATLLVKDNDVPAIALSINKTAVAENAGVYALVGTITRTDDSVNYVKVKFTDTDNSGLILPSTVTLGTGAQSVNFYIGIIDNTLMDGDRTATVKANIYIDNCGCTVQSVSGETQASFTILDNDGEALGISFSKSNVMENTASAAMLTITRNVINGAAMTVYLNVSGTSLLELPETVEFAAGERSVTVSVNTLTDGINTGNQMAVVTATADGYSSAIGYLNISDVNLPDFTVSGVSLGETQAYAGKQTLVNLTLTNM
ncbi:MAG: hypothetical protein J6T06_08600, partial [Victivallales bacterium]|nr:hypothetical protein [Victivallales bacterium]